MPKVRTIKDIVETVRTPEQLEQFIGDFKRWLEVHQQYKNGEAGKLYGVLFKIKDDEFEWVEDGKHEEIRKFTTVNNLKDYLKEFGE